MSVGAKGGPIQCTAGEVCVVRTIHPCPYETPGDSAEELECAAQPAECLQDRDDLYDWCVCVGWAVCPWCQDSFSECSFDHIVVNDYDNCQEPI